MQKHQRHPLHELRDQVGQTLDLFYEKIGKHHRRVDDSGLVAAGYQPPADVSDEDTDLEISLELPGIDSENVEVVAGEGWLTVRGEKEIEREEEGLTYFLRERSYGSFERSFALPKSLVPEKATARFKNGVLIIRVPRKAGAEPAVRQIPVRTR